MKFVFTTITVLLLFATGNAQSLVPNPGFELYTSCPGSYGDFFVTSWYEPTNGSSDYFNICGTGSTIVPVNGQGFQQPHGGVAYVGADLFTQPPFVAEYREYMQVPLTSTLKANTCYSFEMWVSRANRCQLAISEIEAYFSTGPLTTSNWDPLPVTAQISNTTGMVSDTSGWTLITGMFFASGGEDHLTIGNFNDDANTNFIVADPTATNAFSYYFFDDVSLVECESDGLNEQFDINNITAFPNPSAGIFKVEFGNTESIATDLIVYNTLGEQVLTQTTSNAFLNIDLSAFANGVYYCKVRNTNHSWETLKLVKK